MASSKTNFFPNFTWAIPKAFADPISTCRFEQGDTLYNQKEAYKLPWSKARKSSIQAIQILSPSKGVMSKTPGQDDSAFADNWNSEVIFELQNLKKNNSETITTTQGRLYTLLWHGDLKILDDAEDAPPIPQQASSLKNLLEDAVELFSTELLPDPEAIRFFLPCDLAAGLYHDKYLNVKNKLESTFDTTIELKPAGDLGDGAPFLPTVHVAAFTMRGATAEQVENSLKDVLYKPMPGRKGVARFRLKTHGLLL